MAETQATERSPLIANPQPQLSPDPTPIPDTTSSESGYNDETGPPPGQVLLMISGICLLSFTGAIDSTMIATLATPIASDFTAMDSLAWLTTSFFIACTISQPIAGRVTDIFGRKPGFYVCAVLFALGNAVCAMAGSLRAFIVGRAIAGFGGGALGPISSFVIGDLLPLRRRGVWFGIANTCFSMGASIGGLIGGAIADSIGWRWAFWVQAPPVAVAVFLVAVFLKLPKEPAADPKAKQVPALVRARSIDFLGAITLSLFTGTLTFAVNAGGSLYPWSDWRVATAFVVSAACLVLFVVVEQRATLPMLPLHLLRNPTVLFACLGLFFFNMARYGISFYAPVYFFVQGSSATQAGLRFIPEAVAISLSSLTVGYLMRVTGKYYILSLILSAIYIAALSIAAATWWTDTPVWVPLIVLFMVGVANAGILNTSLMASASAVEQEYQAVVTSITYVFRSTGTVTSLALSGAVLQNLLKERLEERLGKFGEKARGWIPLVRSSLSGIWAMPEASWRAAAKLAYVESLRGIWILMLAFTIAGAVLTACAREHRLYKRLDRQDQSDAEGDEA